MPECCRAAPWHLSTHDSIQTGLNRSWACLGHYAALSTHNAEQDPACLSSECSSCWCCARVRREEQRASHRARRCPRRSVGCSLLLSQHPGTAPAGAAPAGCDAQQPVQQARRVCSAPLAARRRLPGRGPGSCLPLTGRRLSLLREARSVGVAACTWRAGCACSPAGVVQLAEPVGTHVSGKCRPETRSCMYADLCGRGLIAR